MRSGLLPLASLVCLLGFAPLAPAAEQTLLNDSLATPAGGTPCTCFVPGEEIAAWLTAPCGGELVGLQVGWASTVGGAPSSTELALRVYQIGAWPQAGALLPNINGGNAEILGPTLVDGAINEFRFLDPVTQNLPLRVKVQNGQTFVVALEVQNQSSGGNIFTPSTVWDADGCQIGRNTVNASPGGWVDACLTGVTGDWMIRAVLECAAEVPALPGPARTLLPLALLLASLVSAAALRATLPG